MNLQAESHGAVEVLHDGRWLRGRLLHTYRQPNGRWRGIVRYTARVGEQYEQGRDQDEIRRPTRPADCLAPASLPGIRNDARFVCKTEDKSRVAVLDMK